MHNNTFGQHFSGQNSLVQSNYKAQGSGVIFGNEQNISPEQISTRSFFNNSFGVVASVSNFTKNPAPSISSPAKNQLRQTSPLKRVYGSPNGNEEHSSIDPHSEKGSSTPVISEEQKILKSEAKDISPQFGEVIPKLQDNFDENLNPFKIEKNPEDLPDPVLQLQIQKPIDPPVINPRELFKLG